MTNEEMEFPITFERFAKEYGFKDDKEVYTNGSDLISIFRVKQWLEHDNKLRTIETDTAYECGKHANRWIPVSERLPEEERDVLICNRNGDMELSRGSYSTEVENDFIWYTSGWRFGEVIAWMPLPEPYIKNEGIMISENTSLEQMNKQFEDFSINKFAEDVDKRIESYLHTKQYVRFGRFPKDNISKNHRGDEIVKEEKGLSVWNCVMVNDIPFPILPDNPSEDCLADYFYMLLSDRNVYLVTGEELDEKGSVGEPLLVGNIEIIREYTEDYDYLKKIHTRRNRKAVQND